MLKSFFAAFYIFLHNVDPCLHVVSQCRAVSEVSPARLTHVMLLEILKMLDCVTPDTGIK